ncbi:GNAT family N-acetyltransferase [Microvirga subterranea]|uniref:GNAT family N-acetyltransferase n=1 Tax=Microvirga subterranea TaxID=186651 RepID=UPI001472E4A9|nr:GNAT family N-acetyltransferase [Microvirga subterranea]
MLIQKDQAGLVGLLPLAIEKPSGLIVHVGAHQAEYQVWLATEENANSFIESALDALAAAYPGRRLELQYLPPGSPVGWCEPSRRWGKRALLQEKKLPLLALGPGSAVEESLRKKSNKSRINRLRKLGPLELIRIQTREQLSAVIDTIADYCDFRQGAINSTLPFRDDPFKKEFCLRLIERPETTHASVLMLGNKIVAANIGLLNRASVSLGIVVHSPFLAEHSPGKILILLLAQELGKQGFSDLDLTPGGDLYKDRSADHYDTVYIVRLFFSRSNYVLEAIKAYLRSAAIQKLKRTNPAIAAHLKAVSRNGFRSLFARTISTPLRAGVKQRKPISYKLSAEQARQYSSCSAFRKNCISDLLCYEPITRRDRSKAEFLLDAARNLEAGAQAYTLVEDGVLLHCGWTSRPETTGSNADEATPAGSSTCVIWDDFTHPKGRSKGLIKMCLEQRLHDAAMLHEIEEIVVKCDAGGDLINGLNERKCDEWSTADCDPLPTP